MTSSPSLASEAQIERSNKALEADNIHAIVAENGVDAGMKPSDVFAADAEASTSDPITRNT